MSFLGWFYAPHHPKTISAGLKKLNHLLIILSVIKMVLTFKNRFNAKYGFKKDEPHSLQEISRLTGYTLAGLRGIYAKGIGAYTTNRASVRPTVKSPEEWAMARVYASIYPNSKSGIIDKDLLIKKKT